LLSITTLFAQDRTTVSAYNSEISDNLDLRAVASIFGDSRDLADFERRLNDPKIQVSNLDLNEDNQVDYLRVIETIEGNAHLIVIQSVLGRDTFQDVATVEVQRDRDNRLQVQVVGDVYMYGPNYIYEPVYSYTPVIYTSFWINDYSPYYSSWHWGYYPSYYYAWTPFPIFRYRNHIGIHINLLHHYNYVNYRRCEVAYNGYYRGGRRGNGYEVRYPNRSFQHRNSGYANRYELDQTRNTRTVGTRDYANTNTRSNNNTVDSPRVNTSTRNESPRNSNSQSASPRANGSTRSYDSPRTETVSPRGNTNASNESPRTAAPRANNQRNETPSRSYTSQANQSPRASEPRSNAPRETSNPRNNSGGQREASGQRNSAQRNESGARGNRRS
jgi:hypothetical protein